MNTETLKQIANLVKKKGFESKTVTTKFINNYLLGGKSIPDNETCYYLWICEIQKWLRQDYNIHIWVSSKTTDKGNTIFIPHGRTIPDTIKKGLVKDVIVYKTFDNNEEALEFGLQEALKLIK